MIASMFCDLKLSELPHQKSRVLRAPTNTRPALWVLEEKGVRIVIKNYRTNGFFYRNTFGRFLVWRENKAYRRLKGLKGIPEFYGVIHGLALAMEEIPGRGLGGLESEVRLPEVFSVASKTWWKGFIIGVWFTAI